MKKRLFDCDCWKDPWFRKLPENYKLFWFFILTNCECWGEWKPDSELASFFMGNEIDLNSALLAFNNGSERISVLDNGNWFVTKFIFFQYGELSDRCNAHKPVIENLKRLKIEGYLKGTHRVHNKDKNKEQNSKQEKDISFGKYENLFFESAFEEIWKKYPSRIGKKEAMRHYIASVKTENDVKSCQDALVKYQEHLAVNTWKVPQNGKTWFNNWRDWVGWIEPSKTTQFEVRRAKLTKELSEISYDE